MERKEIHKEEIDNLISKYLMGDIDTQSLKVLTEWSRESAENSLYVRNKIELWFSSGVAGSTTSFDKEKAFERFKARVEKATVAEKQKQRFVQSRSFRIFYRVAAAIFIILLPLAGYWGGMETVKSGFSDIVVEAPMGALTKLYLPDGTLVWLNAGSKITYSQGFGVENRNLALEGEGYFEVKRNEKVPFEIRTKELDLTVLGTKFNFRNYTDDEEVVVNLLEGKVRLKNELVASADVYMSPNEKVVLSKESGHMVKTKINASNSNLWTKDELYFDELLLEDIAKQLSRSFNVKIEVADSLKNQRFYGSFRIVGNSIEDILETISSTNRMKYKYENNRYVVY